jgi:hypothetical protein
LLRFARNDNNPRHCEEADEAISFSAHRSS